MSIIRVRKDSRYFTASNEPFVDKRLSWETRGLMGYLLTKPDNWQVRFEDLGKQGPAKLTKLRRMLAEARMYGYMNRIRVSKPDGTFDWITEVFESPSQNPSPSKEFIKSSVRLSTSGQATTGKPADIVNTDSISTEPEKTTTTPPNIFTLYESNIGPLTPIIADSLKDAENTFTAEWVALAVTCAAEANVRKMAYINAVLAGYKERGSPDIPRDKTKFKGNQKSNIDLPKGIEAGRIFLEAHGVKTNG